VLQGLDKLGDWTLNRFTGKFDEGSVPIWRDGEILMESVRRFKGQASMGTIRMPTSVMCKRVCQRKKTVRLKNCCRTAGSRQNRNCS